LPLLKFQPSYFSGGGGGGWAPLLIIRQNLCSNPVLQPAFWVKIIRTSLRKS